MDGNAWHESRKRAERLVVALGTVQAEDLKTLQNDELEKLIVGLARVTAMSGQEHVARDGTKSG